MFERYTEKARRVIFFARYEASQFGASAIEAEHILLGLLREDQHLVERFFPRATSTTRSIRAAVEARVVAREHISTSVDLPLSAAAKHVLAYAQEESDRFRHRYIGTEHLLLGLLREEESIAAEILRDQGLVLNEIRDEVQSSSGGFGPIGAGGSGLTPGPDEALDASALKSLSARALFDMSFGALSKSAKFALLLARADAGHLGAESVTPEHLLLGILHLADSTIVDALPTLENAYRDAYGAIADRAGRGTPVAISATIPFSARTFRALAAASERAISTGSTVEPLHLLAGVLSEEGSLASDLLAESEVTPDAVRRAIEGDEAR